MRARHEIWLVVKKQIDSALRMTQIFRRGQNHGGKIMNPSIDDLPAEDQEEIREHGTASKNTRGLASGPITEPSVLPFRLA
jgi:hypothetical protein